VLISSNCLNQPSTAHLDPSGLGETGAKGQRSLTATGDGVGRTVVVQPLPAGVVVEEEPEVEEVVVLAAAEEEEVPVLVVEVEEVVSSRGLAVVVVS
jgi:transcription termination factor Rho